jgi:hypothetical protein
MKCNADAAHKENCAAWIFGIRKSQNSTTMESPSRSRGAGAGGFHLRDSGDNGNEKLTAHIKVKDYATWHTGYDGREKGRLSAGITNGRVFRNVQDREMQKGGGSASRLRLSSLFLQTFCEKCLNVIHHSTNTS